MSKTRRRKLAQQLREASKLESDAQTSQRGSAGDFLGGRILTGVPPLQKSPNRWVPPNERARNETPPASLSPKVVDALVTNHLNRLTRKDFDSISDKIIKIFNLSAQEKDGRMVIHIIRLIFEQAVDESQRNELHARLCWKAVEQIGPEVKDEALRDAQGNPISGGTLLRKYVLNRCQEDFERGWTQSETTGGDGKDSALINPSEARIARWFSLTKFMGELFKLKLITERIMHECIKKLLANTESPDEVEIESLCVLLWAVGQVLDVPMARAHMDVYFTRMKELCKSGVLSPRIRRLLQDVIDLRERRWVTPATTTIIGTEKVSNWYTLQLCPRVLTTRLASD
ncbi:hypothetical protein HYDPIDRAFT_100315 [Hydnomerulius pinastri MD-312]|uniref:Unplaced genomic scaffold scaffold_49, whole genome shotgun sequence n=1 Tax=Hydnomerulius pinastri MD-312 TaxID=994086 RepID=A0A0C9W916_9AGAM|nr:hypothetical protein HYDPIDRAFT_100315 [Hydnomerulius pinastri MD-312]